MTPHHPERVHRPATDMLTCAGRFKLPLSIYHQVPPGWYAEDLVRLHEDLRGCFPITGEEATEPGAPDWMPERTAWLQYRATLYRVIDGIRQRDTACVEIAVRYIELAWIGSYSGFIRERMARKLKQSELTATQVERLSRVFESMVVAGEYLEEFRIYVKLWQAIAPDAFDRAVAMAQARGGPTGRWRWLRPRVLPREAVPANRRAR